MMTANLQAAEQAREEVTDGAFDFDVLVVGSGFGGSVTALRLTEKGYRVGVLEAGAPVRRTRTSRAPPST